MTAIGICLTLAGFFSPWVSHRTAGLALTGFEIGEWIKFLPEMQGENPPLRRTDLYWAPFAAAAGLVALTTGRHRWTPLNWLLILLALTCCFFPIPLLEELRGIGGISANTGRLILTGSGLALVALALLLRTFAPKFRGAILIIPSGLGLVLTSVAFSQTERIVERLYNSLIDPGLAYNLTRVGLLLLILVGMFHLVARPNRDETGMQ